MIGMTSAISRRETGRYLLVLLAAALPACRHDIECTDTDGLSAADIELRVRTLGYVDRSPNSAQICSGCQQFKSRGENVCGGCVVVRGPISPRGRCSKWAAKPV